MHSKVLQKKYAFNIPFCGEWTFQCIYLFLEKKFHLMPYIFHITAVEFDYPLEN